jgi:toxin-antitoxin system PIN domain toxin
MSRTVDTNLLVYASDTGSDTGARAREALHELVSGPTLLVLFWPVLLGYLRIVTHPRISARPLPREQAMAGVESLLAQPVVRVRGEPEQFWSAFRGHADAVRACGNLVPDTHIAALMTSHGVSEIWTRDRDFRRFDGIRVHDPFA